jgi:hypothetical protein
MHEHACQSDGVRTTIELSERHRARLARLAADKGERGFSRFIAEALDSYLQTHGLADERDGARRLRGVLDETAARELEGRVRAIRENWR